MQKIDVPFECKAEGSKGEFEGYASVFDVLDSDDDIFKPGAFKKIRTTQDGKVRVLLYHNGRQIAGKSDFSQDRHGLYVKGRLNLNLSYTPDAYELMKDGSLNGLSVGFNVLPKGSTIVEDSTARWGYVREIHSAELVEYSIVPYGANPEALITDVKQSGYQSARDIEVLLRKQPNISRKQATMLAGEIHRGFQGDPDDLKSLGDPGEIGGAMLANIKQIIQTEFNLEH